MGWMLHTAIVYLTIAMLLELQQNSWATNTSNNPELAIRYLFFSQTPFLS